MKDMPFSELLNRFRKVETSAISDAMEPKLSAMDSEIKSVIDNVKIVGPALTVRCYPGDELALAIAIGLAKEGDVIVVDAGGFKQAGLMGGIGFGYCWQKGVEGVIIDGATRDIEEIKDYGFPVFTKAITPTSAVSASTDFPNCLAIFSLAVPTLIVNPRLSRISGCARLTPVAID